MPFGMKIGKDMFRGGLHDAAGRGKVLHVTSNDRVSPRISPRDNPRSKYTACLYLDSLSVPFQSLSAPHIC